MRWSFVVGLAGAVVAGGLPVGVAPVVAAGPPRVVVNELHYHAADDDPAAEYVELINTTGSNVDLTGWCLDGIGFCFGAGSAIGAGGLLVLPATSYAGSLSNGGERITLRDASGAIVERFTYDDAGQWPAAADGDGASLQRRDPLLAGDKPGNWMSAPPSPGAANPVAASGLLPSFSAVTHTVLPAAGTPLAVSAKVSDAIGAALVYRVGFGEEVVLGMVLDGSGTATATIPGQDAGALVRYRLVAHAASGAVGTWPRQGDGSTYAGTTVARPAASGLPRFEWFMEDDVYERAARDVTLTGDDGYPLVFAYEGQVFDNARVRVKGQISRLFPKKKWKVILPAGHVLDAPLFPEPVDEFALHGSWTDKSYLRETLASELMSSAGVPASQAFPVRVERNGSFFGLYTYVEQQDGTWRERFGLDDSVVYEVGGGRAFALLAPQDAGLSTSVFRVKYEKDTFEYDDDAELRTLIRAVNGYRGAALVSWIEDHVDVASVVNALAASVVIQHQDWGHKNYRLALDPRGKWKVVPTDFDLVLGRRWSNTQGATSDVVGVGGAFEHPGGPLLLPFWTDPGLSELVRVRMRALTEQLLEPDALSARIDELSTAVAADAVLDRQAWPIYGRNQDAGSAARQIMDDYVHPQRARILGTLTRTGRVAAEAPPAVPGVEITDVRFPTAGDPAEYVELTNTSGAVVDLSGATIETLELVVPGGTVLRPGERFVAVHESWGSLVGAFDRSLTATYPESLDETDAPLRLVTRTGAPVDAVTQLRPGSTVELRGTAGRSAVVSVIATDTLAGGYLQLLTCGTTPGATSNLNTDAPGQTIAGLAVVRFDSAGKVCVYNQSSTHVVVDLQAYLPDAAVEDVPDVRLVDTRSGARPAAGTLTPFTGAANRSAIVSVIATDTAGPGYLQLLPCGASPGATSNLNVDRAGQTRAGLAVVRFDATGTACVFSEAAAHVVVDLQAYLPDAAVDDVADVRLLDTRQGDRPAIGGLTPFTGLPNRSAIVSVVATGTSGPGYLQLLPCASAPGGTSNLNVDAAEQTRAVLAVVRLDATGTACVFTDAPAHVVVDLQAYLPEAAVEDVPDVRLVDTRGR